MPDLPQRKLSEDEVFANLKGGDRFVVLRTPQDEPLAAKRNGTASLQTLAAAVADNLPGGLPGPNAAKSLLKEFRFFRAADRDADASGGSCFETDLDYATCCTLTVARIEFYRENAAENFRQQDLECVYDASPTPAGLAYVDGNFSGDRNPSKFVKVAASGPAGTPLPISAALTAIQQDLADSVDLTAGARYDITGNWNAGGAPATVFVQALRNDAFSPSGILLNGGVYSRVKVNVLAGTATADAGAAVVLYDSTGTNTDGAMNQKATTDALATKGSQQVQAQHTQQLATIAVQAAPVYGFLVAGGAPVGYASLDEATADTRPKIFYTFNAPTLVLTTSNAADGGGWAYAANGLGATVQLGNNVVLTLPGNDFGGLNMQQFYIEQAPNTRGGKVRLLTTAPASTPPALLPRINGYCSRPLELVNGGAVCLSGYYGSLTGTGTVYALEPFQADNVAAGVTIVKIGGGGGSYTLPAASATVRGGIKIGPGITVDADGAASVKYDSNTLGIRPDGTLYVLTTSGDISPAATPTNLVAQLSNSGYTCDAAWDAMPGATLYQLYRSVNGGPWSLVASVPYSHFTDNSGVTANTYTRYYVTAANSLGESAASIIAVAT